MRWLDAAASSLTTCRCRWSWLLSRCLIRYELMYRCVFSRTHATPLSRPTGRAAAALRRAGADFFFYVAARWARDGVRSRVTLLNHNVRVLPSYIRRLRDATLCSDPKDCRPRAPMTRQHPDKPTNRRALGGDRRRKKRWHGATREKGTGPRSRRSWTREPGASPRCVYDWEYHQCATNRSGCFQGTAVSVSRYLSLYANAGRHRAEFNL